MYEHFYIHLYVVMGMWRKMNPLNGADTIENTNHIII